MPRLPIRILIVTVCIVLLLPISTVFAQTLPVDDRFAGIQSEITDLVAQQEIPSMAIAVAKDGEIIWEQAFGWADIERRIAATTQTVYPVGSLSKSIMATGVMVLVEEGRLSLEDRVDVLLGAGKLPAYEGQASDIKLWHLLNMAAGIPHGWMTFYNDAQIPQTRQQKDELLAHIGKIVFPPGTFYHYSNFSIGLTEWIIEDITGKDFGSYMDDALFKPLGMHHSAVRENDKIESSLARRYNTQLQPIDEAAYTVAPGGLGFYTSIHDLIRYGLFHLKHRKAGQQPVLSDATLDLMHYFDRGPDSMFALGWFTGDQLISNGSVGGANARLTLVPDEDLAIACLTNVTSPEYIADQMCNKIAAVFIPDAITKSHENRERYRQKYDTPYSSDARLLGEWKGLVKAYDGEKPLVMEFAENGRVDFRLGDQDQVRVEYPRFNRFSFFQGQVNGFLNTYKSQDGANQIRIKLRLDGNELYGYLSAPFASALGSFNIPVYVRLDRQ